MGNGSVLIPVGFYFEVLRDVISENLFNHLDLLSDGLEAHLERLVSISGSITGKVLCTIYHVTSGFGLTLGTPGDVQWLIFIQRRKTEEIRKVKKILMDVVGPFPDKTSLNAEISRTIYKNNFFLDNQITKTL